MKHLSDIKKFERCDKLYWYSKKEETPFLPFVYYGEDLSKLCIKKLKLENYYQGNVGDDNNKFFEHKKAYSTFVNMRFMYHDLRIKIPFMIEDKNGYNLYFTYPSCFPKESDAQGIADCLWVLKKLDVKVNDIKIIHLNSSYVRKDELDVNELLMVEDHFYTDKNKDGLSIKEAVAKRERNLEPILKRMDKTLNSNNIIKERTNVCTRRNKCLFFDKCFNNTCDTSVFNLVSSSKKFELFKQGKDTIDKIDFDEIEGTRHQFAQYMAAKNNKLYINYDGVENFFKSIEYPISYLDFEWETFAYPPYSGMKPYDVLAFQYSLHIESKDGSLTHKEYLGDNDCRKEFVERLIEDLPKSGSIMCYNVEGAEKLRLKQLAKLFPEYHHELESIWNRMIDLAIPFANGLIYDNRMAGMYSLKKLVEIFTDYNYSDLEISHGIEAVREYINFEKSEEENLELRESLLKYCGMDTYAEYLIYHFILDLLRDNNA